MYQCRQRLLALHPLISPAPAPKPPTPAPLPSVSRPRSACSGHGSMSKLASEKPTNAGDRHYYRHLHGHHTRTTVHAAPPPAVTVPSRHPCPYGGDGSHPSDFLVRRARISATVGTFSATQDVNRQPKHSGPWERCLESHPAYHINVGLVVDVLTP